MSNSEHNSDWFVLLAVAIAFLVAAFLNNNMLSGLRIDLTDNKLYTLSDGTRQILGAIEEPINIYFFFSRRASDDLPYLRTYGTRVEELLEEFAEAANGNLHINVIDPQPFSEEEERATGFGIEGVSLNIGAEAIYLGLAGTNAIGDEEIIAVFDPNKEEFLEYDLTKLVYNLANPTKPVIGMISGLPVMGGYDPMTRQTAPRWAFLSQLDPVAEIRELPETVTQIDEDVAVLLVIHPKNLSEATLYAIDQFIVGGGRALLFVDPWAEADTTQQSPANPMLPPARGSSLNRLFEPWGIRVPENEIIGDDIHALQIAGADGRPVRHLALLGVRDDGFNREDVITANLESVNMGFVGHIVSDEESALSVSPLLSSSELSAPLATEVLGMSQDPMVLRAGFNPTGAQYILAARLTGNINSAFETPPAGADLTREHIAASAEPVNMIVVADTDLLTDSFWVRTQNFFGQQVATAFANNGSLVANGFDNLRGNNALIGIRGRPSFSRPFTRVVELQRKAEEDYRIREQQLQQQLVDTETRLSQLEINSDGNNNLILSDEMRAELDRFRAERAGIRKELREVQRNLNQDIETLGLTIKAINIALIPAVLTLVAIGSLLWRRSRGAKR
jgi:ABC-type uncharacterized transport system involved in gliding motility auxiliary subunit